MSLYRVVIDFKQSLMGADPAQLALPSFGSQTPQVSANSLSDTFWEILSAWFKPDSNINSNMLDFKSAVGEENSDNPSTWLDGGEKTPVVFIDQTNTYVVLLNSAEDATLVKIISGHNTQAGESSGSGSLGIDSVSENLSLHVPDEAFNFKPILVGFNDLSDSGNGSDSNSFPPLIVPVPPGVSPAPPIPPTPTPSCDTCCDFKPTTHADGINPDDGQLTLREAIILANSNGNGEDTICLDCGTYTLNIERVDGGGSEGGGPAAKGDLDILESLVIKGEGKDSTFIDANFLSRIFEVYGNISLTLQDLTLTHGNSNWGDGGAILNYGHLFLENVGIIDNYSGNSGGGIASHGGSFEVSVSIYNSVIADNHAREAGGGIFLNNSDLALSFSTINGNSVSGYCECGEEVGGYGGGISASGYGTHVGVYASTISHNDAAFGGGIDVASGASLALINSTISGNVATEGGGGVYVTSDSDAFIANSTVTDNSTHNYNESVIFGGAVQGEIFSSITLDSSIVAANQDNQDLAGFGFGIAQVFHSEGHNLIGNSGLSDFILTQKSTDIVGGYPQGPVIDPLLGPLADNGGPTLTHALYADSPAIGAGSNPGNLPTDQRGEPREFDGKTDIGAYQSHGDSEHAPIVPPIVLDMNGDGAKLVTLSGSSVMFDADGDGLKDVMKSWVSPDDAFLAYDENGDGRVSSVREIAFSSYSPGAKTDLEGLQKAFDTNSDGVLNNQDSGFDHFGVWKDSNQNGSSDKGEFLSLADVGIVSISLNGNNELAQGAGYTVFNAGNYVTNDGAQHAYVDVGLAYTPAAAPAGIKEAIGETSEAPHPLA